MANKHHDILCKNIFKHVDKEDIKEIFTDKWGQIINYFEQNPQCNQDISTKNTDKPTKNNV